MKYNLFLSVMKQQTNQGVTLTLINITDIVPLTSKFPAHVTQLRFYFRRKKKTL